MKIEFETKEHKPIKLRDLYQGQWFVLPDEPRTPNTRVFCTININNEMGRECFDTRACDIVRLNPGLIVTPIIAKMSVQILTNPL